MKSAAFGIISLAGILSLAVVSATALADPNGQGKKSGSQSGQTHQSGPKPSAADVEAGKRAFLDVARVLQSPRCLNCHPAGDAPLQTDTSRRHAMNISRLSQTSGLPCTTCHQDRNSDALGIVGGPPGAPHWGLPPKEMIFEGRTVTALCRQLKDPAQNGRRSLADLAKHVRHDALVLWAWQPGAGRTRPPLTHQQFVTAFQTWVDSRGACP